MPTMSPFEKRLMLWPWRPSLGAVRHSSLSLVWWACDGFWSDKDRDEAVEGEEEPTVRSTKLTAAQTNRQSAVERVSKKDDETKEKAELVAQQRRAPHLGPTSQSSFQSTPEAPKKTDVTAARSDLVSQQGWSWDIKSLATSSSRGKGETGGLRLRCPPVLG